MSQPFIARVNDLSAKREPKEIVEKAVKFVQDYALRSTDARVTLDEVAWLAAFLVKATETAAGNTFKHVVTNPDGSRVIEVTASSTIKTASEAR